LDWGIKSLNLPNNPKTRRLEEEEQEQEHKIKREILLKSKLSQ
jgi:hypothetical protein